MAAKGRDYSKEGTDNILQHSSSLPSSVRLLLPLPQIAESLPHSYFNTFGGSNLAMALGEATLDVVIKEKLHQKAERLGTMLRAMLEGLAQVGTLGLGKLPLLPPSLFSFLLFRISDEGLALLTHLCFPPSLISLPEALPRRRRPRARDDAGRGAGGGQGGQDTCAGCCCLRTGAGKADGGAHSGMSLPSLYSFFMPCSFLPVSLQAFCFVHPSRLLFPYL